MREIKFRAYNRNTKNMWWFDLMWGNTDTHGSGWIGMLPIGETREHSGGINGSDNRTQVDPTDCEIMQFTGLKDKNGKEIYEGDIVANYIDGKEYFRELYEIAYSEHRACWQLKVLKAANYVGSPFYISTLFTQGEGDFMEVIGNIYENGDLLQK